MAETNKNESNRNLPKHSGFEAPMRGTYLPKGTTCKQNPDGTVTPIFPDEQEEKEEGDS